MIQHHPGPRRWFGVCLLCLLLAGCPSGGGGGGPTRLSGTMSAPESTEGDGDVNELLAAFSGNDTFAAAQSVPNPVTVGGYLNQAFFGAPGGRSSSTGDERDIFRITATANQQIRLAIADATSQVNNDLQLYLLRGDCTDANANCQTSCSATPPAVPEIIAASVGTSLSEVVTVPSAGTYFVEVCVLAGASNYLLSIGQAPLLAGGFDPAADFVPGEVIVRLSERAELAGAGELTALAAGLGLEAKAGAAGREMLMRIGEGAARAETLRRLGVDAAARARFAGAGTADKRDTLAVIEALRRHPDVVYAEPNYWRYPLATPSDDGYPFQWHYPLINLPLAWDVHTGDSSVVVGIIDTGIVLNHPDLVANLVPGFDFISDPANAGDGNGIGANPDDPGDGGGLVPSSFHGTHVGGTVGAEANDGRTPSVAGVAWQVGLMPLRVLGRAGGTSFDILQAVRYAAGLANNAPGAPGQDQGAARADIINLSLGGPGSSQAEQSVYTQARGRGVIVIAAAGNSATSTPSFPAAYDGVVSVSAVRLSKQLAPYSNFGSTVDVAAPGGDTSQNVNGDPFVDGVLSTGASDSSGSIVPNFPFFQGTSMAAPHVAGVAALMRSVRLPGTLPPDEFDAFLIAGQLTEDLGNDGPAVRNDSFGFGLIDAARAVEAAGGVLPPARLVVSPASLNFGTVTSSVLITAAKVGDASPVTINSSATTTDAGGSWLTLVPPGGDPTAFGAYEVRVNRSGLDEGVYTGAVEFDADTNSVTVPVIMQVSNEPVTGDVGHQFVLLLEAESFIGVAQFDAGPSSGNYAFQFDDVPDGSYILISGSDNDFDGFICDAGESCGGYPVLDSIAVIDVTRSLSGLDFPLSFGLTATGASTGKGVPPGIGRQGFRRLDLAD